MPETPEEEEAERARHEAAERLEEEESGQGDWDVAVHVDSLDEMRELDKKLRAEGLPVERRWKYLLVGAPTEDHAKELAERVRGMAPDDATIEVIVNPNDLPNPMFVAIGCARGQDAPGLLASVRRGRHSATLFGAAVAVVLAATVALPAGAGVRNRPCSARFPVVLERPAHTEIAQAKHGTFWISGIRTHLHPPIDWSTDPVRSYVYQRKLASLTWLDPLFYAYSHSGDKVALADAEAILVDFANQHGAADPSNGTVWGKKRVGDRLNRLVYAARAGNCTGTLQGFPASQVLGAAQLHAHFLRRIPNSRHRNNLDLVQGLALMTYGRYLPSQADARAIYREGARRFRSGVARLVDHRTGVHLEQTASYQFVSIDRVRSFLRLARGGTRGLRELLRLMRTAASWFVMPDGDIVPFGDTPSDSRAPEFARHLADRHRGMSKTLRSGFEMVRSGSSYLATTAGYFRPIHKQADELSFDLFERGHPVIVESGRVNPGRGPRGAKPYSRSAQAHSTLTVDGRSFRLGRDFYGSALDARGSKAGWYAIAGHNPLLRGQHVSHRRLYLYRPGVGLVIADRLHSAHVHAYQRWLQVAPGVRAKPDGQLERLLGSRGFRATVWTHAEGGSRLTSRILRGQRHPLRGWWAPPGISRLRPRNAIDTSTRGRSLELITTIALGRRPITARARHGCYRIGVPGTGTTTIRVRRSGTLLHLGIRRGRGRIRGCP